MNKTYIILKNKNAFNFPTDNVLELLNKEFPIISIKEIHVYEENNGYNQDNLIYLIIFSDNVEKIDISHPFPVSVVNIYGKIEKENFFVDNDNPIRLSLIEALEVKKLIFKKEELVIIND